MSTQRKTSEECFQQLVESVTTRMKMAVKATVHEFPLKHHWFDFLLYYLIRMTVANNLKYFSITSADRQTGMIYQTSCQSISVFL